MSDTHPNAFRIEADEKRKQAQQLLNEAKEAEAKASAAEREASPETPADTKAASKEDKDSEEKANKNMFGRSK